MSERSAELGSEKNWAFRRLIFSGKELAKGLDEDSDKDWSLGSSGFNEGTADGSDGV